MRDLLELAPPGIDELAAIIDVTETLGVNAGARRDLIVVDTAPTGHALRLLEMPALVHDWVKAIMAILLKYQPSALAAWERYCSDSPRDLDGCEPCCETPRELASPW